MLDFPPGSHARSTTLYLPSHIVEFELLARWPNAKLGKARHLPFFEVHHKPSEAQRKKRNQCTLNQFIFHPLPHYPANGPAYKARVDQIQACVGLQEKNTRDPGYRCGVKPLSRPNKLSDSLQKLGLMTETHIQKLAKLGMSHHPLPPPCQLQAELVRSFPGQPTPLSRRLSLAPKAASCK